VKIFHECSRFEGRIRRVPGRLTRINNYTHQNEDRAAVYYRTARCTVIRIWDGERERTVRRYISVNYIDRRRPTTLALRARARPWDSCEAWVSAPAFLFAKQRSGGRSPRFTGSFRSDRSTRSPERNFIFTSAGRRGDENCCCATLCSAKPLLALHFTFR